MSRIFGAAIIALALSISQSHAAVTISSQPTQNMACAGGVCSPTAATANLNTDDVENYLASGKLKVTTTGSGVQADDIVVEAGFNWTGASALVLDAYHSVTFQSPVAVNARAFFARHQ